ncbi:hypothetical protein CKO25_11275 [Thiocapsa imhoffii]|uniref:Radical SAM core domain-containing protein n=1 Tax=Thiocapsa imhoffii TaxID=382777 RepID=A0A9X0WI80_9GAMM|nr:radical SAM protein [Thiocapsa imhoffii]MBK1645211.1 hypothetical protein [Thiocapsa imhoffii]
MQLTIDWSVTVAEVCLFLVEGEDPLPELVALEYDLSQGPRPIRAIALQAKGLSPPQRDRLMRLSYHEGAPGCFTKTIPTRRAVRFSMTEKCNYRCFFCHEEGLEMARVRQDAHEQQVFRVLDQLKALGYNDVTFTGGEPLLKWKQMVSYLNYMRRIDYRPDIKVVSNGLALRQEFLDVLQDDPGRIRFNISMHSLDPVLHDRIIHQLSDRPSRRHQDLTRIQARRWIAGIYGLRVRA